MVQRGKPSNIDKYVLVSDNDKIYMLQKQGIYPRYLNEDGAYFLKELMEMVVEKV